MANVKTVTMILKNGTKSIYHQTSRRVWDHPEDDPHMMDFDNEFRRGTPIRHPCPVCGPGSATELDGGVQESGSSTKSMQASILHTRTPIGRSEPEKRKYDARWDKFLKAPNV